MSYMMPDFLASIDLVAATYKWNANRAAELTTITGLLATDPTTHSAEMETPPVGLQPGAAANTKFTNDILLIVNAGKAGNLLPADMATAINAGLAGILAPVNTTAPAITGTATVGSTLTCSTGAWQYTPSSYSFQWKSGAANVGVGSTYVIVAGDSGKNITCQVAAVNAAGSTTATSNAVAIP